MPYEFRIPFDTGTPRPRLWYLFYDRRMESCNYSEHDYARKEVLGTVCDSMMIWSLYQGVYQYHLGENWGGAETFSYCHVSSSSKFRRIDLSTAIGILAEEEGRWIQVFSQLDYDDENLDSDMQAHDVPRRIRTALQETVNAIKSNEPWADGIHILDVDPDGHKMRFLLRNTDAKKFSTDNRDRFTSWGFDIGIPDWNRRLCDGSQECYKHW